MPITTRDELLSLLFFYIVLFQLPSAALPLFLFFFGIDPSRVFVTAECVLSFRDVIYSLV